MKALGKFLEGSF